MDDSPISKLVQQCKASDVDAKIDAVTKLQAEFESEAEITDADALIQALKACLRISNQHLQAATLAALPPLLPLLLSHGASRPVAAPDPTSGPTSTSSAGSASVNLYHLRQVINAFLSTGGIIDRLGDTRERTREKARESLVLIGGFAFRGGSSSNMGRSRDGKTVETPLQLFERFLRENGLGSKVWRVREQSIIALVEIRRAHHLFPLRNYVSLLVGALEDSDSTVRETARTSIVELFTGPGVTDAARSDLKREMTKKNVRKTIVDSVLSRIFSGNGSAPAGEDSENGDAKRGYIPPSLALQGRRPTTSSDTAPGSSMSRAVSQSNVSQLSRPASRAAVMTPAPMHSPTGDGSADVQAVYIASSRDLEVEFANMFKPFQGKETEHNWAARDRAITRIRGMLKGDAHTRYADTFLAHLKPMADASLKTLASLRTTVATNTCSMYNELAMTLGANMDPVCELLLTHLLRMGGFTKKITAQASQASAGVILTYTSSLPRVVIPLLWTTLQDKTPQARNYAVEHLRKYFELHGAKYKNAIEATGMFDTLEKCVRVAVQDPNIGVRQSARPLFWEFHSEWPARAAIILNAQDTAGRKALEKANPNPGANGVEAPASPATRKSSVAAAIAASRAKAKAIATAPPTLRHQATSAARTISPPKRSMSPSLSTGSVSGPPTPPISPRSRIMSSSSTRSVSNNKVSAPSHSRTSSSDSNQSTTQRRPTSPLVSSTQSPPRGSVMRRAMQTALPASPPATTVTPPSPAPRRFAPNRQPVDPAARTSVALPSLGGYEEQDLLTAVAIPLPDDSDSDMELDDSINHISFSTPYERYPPAPRSTSTSQNSFSPKSNGRNPMLSTGSPPAGVPQPIVEDVLRARAEQAQSAAERLLELVEPEDEGAHPPHMAPSLLLQSNSMRLQSSPARPTTTIRPPVTPANKAIPSVWRQAAAFQDSPAYNGSSTLMTDMLKPVAPQYDSSWWRKRMALANERKSLRTMDRATDYAQLQEFTTALNEGTADVAMLKSTALFCISHPFVEPISPLSTGLYIPASPSPVLANAAHLAPLQSDLWTTNKNFDRLFSALEKFLQPDRELELLEYGLIVLWEMLEYLPFPMEGHEADVFAVLFRVRYSNKQSILDASNIIRDALTARIDPVYGLTTLHASMLAFLAEPAPESTHAEAKAGTHAYALIALGKFVLRLPGEILEDELPRLKSTLINALNDPTSLVVRESAASAIIAAQLVLRDETHLFALLDGLADDKKNLLTYLFDKHAARSAGEAGAGMDRLEREMRRLDGRTGTPPRPVVSAR